MSYHCERQHITNPFWSLLTLSHSLTSTASGNLRRTKRDSVRMEMKWARFSVGSWFKSSVTSRVPLLEESEPAIIHTCMWVHTHTHMHMHTHTYTHTHTHTHTHAHSHNLPSCLCLAQIVGNVKQNQFCFSMQITDSFNKQFLFEYEDQISTYSPRQQSHKINFKRFICVSNLTTSAIPNWQKPCEISMPHLYIISSYKY